MHLEPLLCQCLHRLPCVVVVVDIVDVVDVVDVVIVVVMTCDL